MYFLTMRKSFLKRWIWIVEIGFALGGFCSEKWEKLEDGYIHVFYKSQHQSFGHTLLSIAKEQLPELLWLFQWPLKDTIRMYIAENPQKFNELTENAIPEWGIAAIDLSKNQMYFKSTSFDLSETELRKIIMHELCHWVMHKASRSTTMDRWFLEGVAVFVSKEYGLWEKLRIAQSLVFGQTLRLEEIDHVLRFNPEKATLAYAESVSAVEYLIDQYGFEAIQEIVFRMAQGISFQRAFRAGIGLSLDEFQKVWMSHIKRKYAKYLMLQFSFLLSLVFVILFFMALWSTHKRTQQIQKHWEKGEKDEKEIFPEDPPWNGIPHPPDGDALDMDEFSSHRAPIC